jgi:predicted dinucleotide-binding enzyme
MDIGIIGSGKIGATAARGLAAAGHHVTIANSRGPETLGDVLSGLGPNARAATAEEAARAGDVVLVAVPLHAVPSLPASELAGRIVIDANNYYPQRDGQIPELDAGELTSSELVARELPGARVVKAFNTMQWELLGSKGRRDAPREERLALLVAGDDAEAKATVSGLIEDLGFGAVDTGSLAEGGLHQAVGAPLYGNPVTVLEAERLLAGS